MLSFPENMTNGSLNGGGGVGGHPSYRRNNLMTQHFNKRRALDLMIIDGSQLL
jgi:hypothetical protein